MQMYICVALFLMIALQMIQHEQAVSQFGTDAAWCSLIAMQQLREKLQAGIQSFPSQADKTT